MRLATVLLLLSTIMPATGCDALKGSGSDDSKPDPVDPAAGRTFDTSVTLPMMAGWTLPTPMVAHGGTIGVLLEAEPADVEMQLSLFKLVEPETCSTVVEDRKLLREPTAHKRGTPPFFVEHESGTPGTRYCVAISNHGTTETSATMRFAVK